MEDHGEEKQDKEKPCDEANSCSSPLFNNEQEAIDEVLRVFTDSQVIDHYEPADVEERELAEAYSRRLAHLASRSILFIHESEKKAILRNRLEGTRYSRGGQRKIMKKLNARLGHYYYKMGVMLTLTFDIKRFSKCEAWRIVGNEMRRFQNAVNESRFRRGMKKRVSSFKVMEGTDRGYPCPHIVFPGLKWLGEVELLRKLWGNGNVWVSFTGSVRPASYACKYISKMGLHDEWLPMTDELFSALFAHRQKVKGEWVFPDPGSEKPFTVRQHFMKKLCEKAKVKPFGFHAIRHLTASILAQADVPMVTIQRILRHKNLMTTERYIRGLEPVKPALEILSRRNSRPNVPTTVHLQDHIIKQAV